VKLRGVHTDDQSNPLDDFGLLTLKQVAEILRCSKAHVGKVIDGRVVGCAAIPCVRLGRRKLVRRESLAGWLEKNETATMGASPVRGVGKRA
jgi:excisionase family DNA binding protein